LELEKTRVVVAMSGGVDSSVAAALLKQQGHEVIGLMMRLWSEPGKEAHNRCCTPDSMAQARHMAEMLDIPFYVVDTKDVFHQNIVQFFIDGYAAGVTPNPCMECNRHIRWDFLLNKALSLGATHLATGHYARVRRGDAASPAAGRLYQLIQAIDTSKDQSYVLSVLGQRQLAHALFPVGDYTKPEIRELAHRFNLPVAERPDSQDLCFLSDNDYRRFLTEHAPGVARPGPIVNRAGQVLGRHQGLPFYTIGQRKGIGVAGPEPYYVLGTDLDRNALIVGAASDLGQTTMRVGRMNWVSGQAPAGPFACGIKIRYKAAVRPGTVTPLDPDRAGVMLNEPARDVTPGQAAVFYQDQVCLGGGIILR
jgi:tRNA-uridine 2-sulfurtransferase